MRSISRVRNPLQLLKSAAHRFSVKQARLGTGRRTSASTPYHHTSLSRASRPLALPTAFGRTIEYRDVSANFSGGSPGILKPVDLDGEDHHGEIQRVSLMKPALLLLAFASASLGHSLSADKYSSLVTAISVARGGGMVLLPAGYRSVLHSQLTIAGAGITWRCAEGAAILKDFKPSSSPAARLSSMAACWTGRLANILGGF